MKIEHGGTGSLLDLVSKGWGPSRAINTPDDGAPDIGQFVPRPSEAPFDGPVPAPPAYAVPPAAIPQAVPSPISGIMLETGMASLFGEVFELTPEEKSAAADILVRAYERILRSRIGGFRAVFGVPQAERQQPQAMLNMPEEAPPVQEEAR